MPFKRGKFRQQGKGNLGRYHTTRRNTSVVRTVPAATSSASAAADGVGDDRGGSGASGVDKRGSAEAIAAAALVSMNPPVKQLAHAEEAAQRGRISLLHHQMGSPGKTSDTVTFQAITTRLDLLKGDGLQAVRRTLVRKRKREEHQGSMGWTRNVPSHAPSLPSAFWKVETGRDHLNRCCVASFTR